jgi:hypothetical protein
METDGPSINQIPEQFPQGIGPHSSGGTMLFWDSPSTTRPAIPHLPVYMDLRSRRTNVSSCRPISFPFSSDLPWGMNVDLYLGTTSKCHLPLFCIWNHFSPTDRSTWRRRLLLSNLTAAFLNLSHRWKPNLRLPWVCELVCTLAFKSSDYQPSFLQPHLWWQNLTSFTTLTIFLLYIALTYHIKVVSLIFSLPAAIGIWTKLPRNPVFAWCL